MNGHILNFTVGPMVWTLDHAWVISEFFPRSVHLLISLAGTNSTELLLLVVSPLSVRRIREGEEVVYLGQSGELESLYMLGSPLRMKDSQ